MASVTSDGEQIVAKAESRGNWANSVSALPTVKGTVAEAPLALVSVASRLTSRGGQKMSS